MNMTVTVILWLMLIYLFAGIVFASLFLFKGIHIVDEGAHGSSRGFYIIIIPGIVLLWPLLLKKWIHAVSEKKISKPADTIEMS
jgi:hypothetical protein